MHSPKIWPIAAMATLFLVAGVQGQADGESFVPQPVVADLTPAPTAAPVVNIVGLTKDQMHTCGVERENDKFYSYHGDVNGAIEFSTCEDNPTWEHCLPSLDDNAQYYQLSCFPKKAGVFEWNDNGCFTYKPEKDVFSSSLEDKDIFSYHGYVTAEIGLANPDKYDCQQMLLENNMCRTEIKLINVYIGPVNDAPIAAYGEGYFPYTAVKDVVKENNEQNAVARSALEPPFALVRSLPATDIDDVDLTYRITQQPENGVAVVVEGNTFKYIPNPLFTGQDFFSYTVDDSEGDPEIGPRPLEDSARIIVQVGEIATIPPPISATIPLDEDTHVIGVLGRGYYTGARIDLIRYQITEDVSFGTMEVLCDGLEVYDAFECNQEINATEIGGLTPVRQAYFRYEPNPDYWGVDRFMFKIFFEGFENDPELQTDPATITLNVRPINDPPIVYGGIFEAPMVLEPGNRAGITNIYGTVVITAEDVDSTVLDLRISRRVVNGTKVGEGRLFTRLSSSGVPADPLDLDGVAIVEMVNKVSTLYYVADPLTRGEPLGEFVVRASDRLSFSAPDDVEVHVKCRRGYAKGEPGTAQEFQCLPCPGGTMSMIVDSDGCTPCFPGSYSPGGLEDCPLCEPGSYAPNFGMAQCDTCPYQSTSQPGSVERTECYCLAGWYGEHGKPCLECPKTGRTGANKDDVDRDDLAWTYCGIDGLRWPLPQRGFYVNPSTEPVTIRECSPLEACQHYNQKGDDGRVTNGTTCAAGYENEGCCACKDDHYRKHGKCTKCPESWVFTVVVIGFIIVIFLPLIFKLMPKFVEHFSAIDIIILFTQVSGVFGFYYLKWPIALVRWFSFSSLFNLNLELLHLECNYDWDFEKKWTWTMIIPLIALIAIVAVQILTFFVMIFQRTVGRGIRERNPSFAETRIGRAICGRRFVTKGLFAGKSKQDFKRLIWHTVRGYLTFLHIGYTFLSMGTFEMFDCVESISNNMSYLEPSPCIRCYVYDSDTTWGKLYPYAVLCTLLYPIGIFVLFGALLYSQRHKLNTQRAQDLLGAWIFQYKPEHFYYQMAVLARLFGLTLIITANRDSSAGGALRQAVFGIMVLMVMQIFKALMRPYISMRLDAMEGFSLLSNFATLMCGATFVSFKVTTTFRNVLTVVNIVIIILTYVGFMAMLLWDWAPLVMYKMQSWWRSRKSRSKARRVSSVTDGGAGMFLQRDGAPVAEDMAMYINPAVAEALYQMECSASEREEILEVFRELRLSHEVLDTMHNEDRKSVNDYLQPEVGRELINRLSKRSVEENDEMLRVVEQVTGLDDHGNGLKAIYSNAKEDILDKRRKEKEEWDPEAPDYATNTVVPHPTGAVSESASPTSGTSGAVSEAFRPDASNASSFDSSPLHSLFMIPDRGEGQESDEGAVSASFGGLWGHEGNLKRQSRQSGSGLCMDSIGSEEGFMEAIEGENTRVKMGKNMGLSKVHPM
mmetsp:Transcript_45726/g.145675  ORF Transcript_45726/g.145675 Transcript_45726/m.145675 type:complete len:1462 (-) Transcript_45726:1076-5461(-)